LLQGELQFNFSERQNMDVLAGPHAKQDYSARGASLQWSRPDGRSAALRVAV
jgi:hypothetical protein